MSSLEGDSQPTLEQQAALGSRTAFSSLVEPHLGRLIALATRMLGSRHQGEEAVQDGLASVWLARNRLDPDQTIGPYLTTAVLNKCRDQLRKQKAKRFFGIGASEDALSIADDEPNPEEVAVKREELRQIQAEIERLPIRLREALVLVTIDDRSQAEAASLLGVSEKAIETRVYRARQRLREKLEKF